MKVKFPGYESFLYVEVFEVTEWKNGAIYKTKPKGFARATRNRQLNEVYVPLSLVLMGQEFIELDLLD